jgi:thiol:disulfide interchange protein DsbD
MYRTLRRLLTLLFILALGGGSAVAEEFLDPAVAFKPTARALDGGKVEVHFTIASGYYLYRDKFKFAIEGKVGESSKLGTPSFPAGKVKHDPNFGDVEVFYREVAIGLPVEPPVSGELALRLTYQGCADAGLCYPPQTKVVTVAQPAAAGSSASAATADGNGGDESSRIASTLGHAGFWANLALFFVAGLGLALTPCVFPMIPILSGIIVGSGKTHRQISRGRAFVLSLAYVLGMALTYALVGIAAGLTGTLLSNALQNAWVLGAFALIFVLLSGSMFGFYELQLPTFLQSKVSEEVSHIKGGSLPTVAAMGALSALICGPCVAAPLAGALLYIGQTHDAVLGGAALFMLALGMGAPLLLVGLSAGTLLPKSGPWMENVKRVFGVVMLAVALWFVAPLLPPVLSMLGWALLLMVPAIYLHALDPLPPHARGWPRLWKGIGVVLLLTGAAILIGALAGNRDPLQPLSGLAVSHGRAEAALPFASVKSVAELDVQLKTAGKPVLLDFYADWCVSCKEMERETFSDPAVRAKLAERTLLRADVTANSADDAALLKRFGLFGPPGIIVFDKQGQELPAARVIGFQDAPTFLRTLNAAKAG